MDRTKVPVIPSVRQKPINSLDLIREEPSSNESSHLQLQGIHRQTKVLPVVANGDVQVVIVNNRKFVKSKSPFRRQKSPQRTPVLGLQQSRNKENSAETVKIALLEKRISQLHKQKQEEIIRLLNENKRIQQLFVNQRQVNTMLVQCDQCKKKNQQLMFNLTQSSTVKEQESQLDLQVYGEKISALKKKMEEIENAFVKSEQQKGHLQSINKKLQKQLSENGVELEQCKFKSDYLVQKVNSLYQQIQTLKSSFTGKLNDYQKESAKFAQSDNIEETALENIRLKGVSHQNSILMSDEVEMKVRKSPSRDSALSFASLAENSMQLSKKRSSAENRELDEKYMDSFKQLGLLEETASPKRWQDEESEKSLPRLKETVKNLKEKQSKMSIQNQILNSKLNQMLTKNSEMAATIEMAFNTIHKREVELESKIKENSNLVKCLQDIKNGNENRISSDKAFQLSLSASCSQFEFGRKDCQKCQQLMKILNQFQQSDPINEQMGKSVEIRDSF